VLVVTRFTVAEQDASTFGERARAALAALAARPGYLGGRLARATDDATRWLITTEWDEVGSYRRALSGFDVKMTATPLLAQAAEEPSAYEVLYDDGPGAVSGVRVSDRARDAGTVRIGEAAGPAVGREAE
jgi:heme oxygenase (mycobilin-producing)